MVVEAQEARAIRLGWDQGLPRPQFQHLLKFRQKKNNYSAILR